MRSSKDVDIGVDWNLSSPQQSEFSNSASKKEASFALVIATQTDSGGFLSYTPVPFCPRILLQPATSRGRPSPPIGIQKTTSTTQTGRNQPSPPPPPPPPPHLATANNLHPISYTIDTAHHHHRHCGDTPPTPTATVAPD
ncbi:hypothetical protein EX30DRAFT_241302 [Ascodesmis nigricans]|uniref:Uncharacterized protein n=1 Tax=Ascodesmis nigricans TaxID=341454 RepID=A0A4S2MYW2_9PEZI|nr:hypothetical protein EX30DRAFT_241302 [Ascodesmis nigricans]